MMNKVNFILSIIFLTFQIVAGEVTLLARLSPAGTMEIKSEKLLGQIVEKQKLYTAKKLYVEVQTLKSNVELRDQHIHEYLGKDRTIELTNLSIEKKSKLGRGVIKINNIEKEIKFKIDKSGTTKEMKTENLITSFVIDQRDFQLPKAQFMGISVQPEIKIDITIFPKDITQEDQQ